MTGARKYIPPLTGALVIALLPHFPRLPAWIIAWCLLLWGYLLVSVRLGWRLPGKKWRILLAAAGVAGLLATYSVRLDAEAFVSLLAVMAALKPFESRTQRDRIITVFIAYFIIISSLLQSESLAVTIYMFVSVLASTAALVIINDPRGRYASGVKRAGVIMGQALPLMIVLFFIFPRMQGSLFGLPGGRQAVSGFSDRLSPGGISRLAENHEPAFRAEFNGPIPPVEQRYWRGVVFLQFDGRSWRRPKQVPRLPGSLKGEKAVNYTVSLEPHGDRWIFALDLPARAPGRRSTLLKDFTIRARRPVTRPRRYRMRSIIRHDTSKMDWGVDMAARLPETGNPRARQLARELARGAGGPAQIVQRGLDYLENGGFEYTLRPPLLGRHPVDDFLFSSKRGYCEHYASAFAWLMRAAGVPARIVGGYLGGEQNPYANYLVIYQSDAHAWVEVWYPDRGWTRVDPTLAVAPGRLSGGAEGALSPGELPRDFARKYLGRLVGLFERVRWGWDALSTRWEAWFAGYSRQQQLALLQKLGLYASNWEKWLALLLPALCLAVGVTAVAAMIRLHRSRPRKDPVGRGYEKFCKKLGRAGLVRPPCMGPGDYAAYVVGRRPELAAAVESITDVYIRLRYRQACDPGLEKRFLRRVRAFNPASGGFRRISGI